MSQATVVHALLTGSAVIALAGAVAGLFIIAMEYMVNGGPRRRDVIAGRLVTFVLVLLAWSFVALGIGGGWR